MTHGMGSIDAEINALERRIAEDRDAMQRAVLGCRNSVRTVASSPKTLLAVAGLGFAAGKILFRPGKAREERPRKSGWLGLLAGTAVSLMQPRLGLGTVARWALERVFRDRSSGQVRSAAAARAWAGSPRRTTTPAGQ
ncbi:MAG TPA: hypothetical protein VLN59_02940 [Burkholderiales bacterium]|nr:hypothetical protein [Burkholderiales bacterium]